MTPKCIAAATTVPLVIAEGALAGLQSFIGAFSFIAVLSSVLLFRNLPGRGLAAVLRQKDSPPASNK